MAVYTSVNYSQAQSFLKQYEALGTLVSLSPIQEGIENSNFFLKTSKEKFILTLIERRRKT